jgi:O-antigen ligase
LSATDTLGSLAPPRTRALAPALFGLSLFLVPLARVGSFRALGPMIQLSDLVFSAAAASWLYGLWQGHFKLVHGGARLPLLVYTAASVASLASAPPLRPALTHLVALAFLMLVFLMTASLASTAAGWRIVLGSWLCGAALTGLLGVVSVALFYAGLKDRNLNVFLWNYGSIPVGSYPRIAGLFQNANMLCNYLVVSLAAAFAFWPQASASERRLLAIGVACMALTSVFTLSAGFAGAAGAAALVWIGWQHARGRLRPWREGLVGAAGLLTMLAFVFVSVFLLVPAGQGDVRLGPVDLELQTSGRMATWSAAWQLFLEHPLLGAGLGTGVLISHPRALLPMEYWNTPLMQHPKPSIMEAHNVWLGIASQVGVFGLAAFAALVATLLLRLRTRSHAGDALTNLALVGGVVGAILYHGLFGSFEESRQYWWLMGLIAAEKPWQVAA